MAGLVKNCERCGVEFVTPSNYRKQRFCKKQCSASATSRAMWIRRDPTLALPLAERFASRIVIAEDTGCWLWQGPFTGPGYGATVWKDSPESIASRLAWHLHRGPIPEGLLICHNCPGGDNPACVNPAHLFLGTKSTNALDFIAKGGMHHIDRRNEHGCWI